MFCTDSLENLATWHTVKAAQWIPAKNIYVVGLDSLVAEFFHLNRRFCITLASAAPSLQNLVASQDLVGAGRRQVRWGSN
jgi:hypothetical protein